MELLERIDEIKLNDNNKYYLDEILVSYKDYLEKISQFEPKLLKNFLDTLKEMELINNQEAEKESTMLMVLYKNSHRNDSIKKIVKLYLEKRDITKEDLKQLHKLLMSGTQNDLKTYNFRDTDDEFVGAINSDGSKRIDYMPVPSSEIESDIDKVLDFLNHKKVDNPFINPFIIHALIAVMQPFYDGNTRLSRLVQYAEIWKNTNTLYGKEFESPIIYLSKNYLISRGFYRDLITNLAVNKNNEAWNKWFTYNLNMLSEQLYYLDHNIERIKN